MQLDARQDAYMESVWVWTNVSVKMVGKAISAINVCVTIIITWYIVN